MSGEFHLFLGWVAAFLHFCCANRTSARPSDGTAVPAGRCSPSLDECGSGALQCPRAVLEVRDRPAGPGRRRHGRCPRTARCAGESAPPGAGTSPRSFGVCSTRCGRCWPRSTVPPPSTTAMTWSTPARRLLARIRSAHCSGLPIGLKPQSFSVQASGSRCGGERSSTGRRRARPGPSQPGTVLRSSSRASSSATWAEAVPTCSPVPGSCPAWRADSAQWRTIPALSSSSMCVLSSIGSPRCTARSTVD